MMLNMIYSEEETSLAEIAAETHVVNADAHVELQIGRRWPFYAGHKVNLTFDNGEFHVAVDDFVVDSGNGHFAIDAPGERDL